METCFILGGPGARIRRFYGSLKVTVFLCIVTNCCVISDSFRSLARFEVLTVMRFKSYGMLRRVDWKISRESKRRYSPKDVNFHIGCRKYFVHQVPGI